MKIMIVLYEGVDLLDLGGPYEVFLTASRMAVRAGEEPPFSVTTSSVDGGPVTSFGGLVLTPQASSDDITDSSTVVVVPGTTDIAGPLADVTLLSLITRLADGAEIVASVCTGAFLLAEVGLLEGASWTTHWEDIDELANRSGSRVGQTNVRWVDSGTVVTAAGLSSGIAMSLHLVDRLVGRSLALRTARQLEYDWSPNDPTTQNWSQP